MRVTGRLGEATIKFILLGFLLIAVSGCERKNMTKTGDALKSERWWTYLAEYDGTPGSTMVNLALKKSAPRSDYPILLVTGVSYESPPTNSGLPKPDELNALNELSDKRKGFINQHTKAIFAGIFTHKNDRLDYFYITDSNGLGAALSNFYQTECPARKPYINIKPDEHWEAYLDFLYPNSQTIEFHRKELERIGALK